MKYAAIIIIVLLTVLNVATMLRDFRPPEKSEPQAIEIQGIPDREDLFHTYAVSGVWERPIGDEKIDVCFLTGHLTIQGELKDPAQLMHVRNHRYPGARLVEIHDIEVVHSIAPPRRVQDSTRDRLPRHLENISQ